MCGRFTRSSNFTEHANQATFLGQLGLWQPISAPPRYNIAPTQQIAAVRSDDHDRHELVMLRWGLVPGWAPDLAIGAKMINARGESVAEKPSFRHAFKKRRCLVLADGFYEWKKAFKAKQPYFIHLKGGEPFCFAGLWERWSRGEKPVETCTIITTEANALMKPLHDRMPVIVAPADYGLWLDAAVQEPERLTPLLRPYADAEMEAYPVSTLVNSPKNNSPKCLEPLM
ncbi:MAG TPA: SOS response-associated peptidase [Pirellulales bacterium]|jgi:putative SOS response-associated peptidase YedK|nr:SOS response-associated peptidase [Pirellulales bacterium]